MLGLNEAQSETSRRNVRQGKRSEHDAAKLIGAKVQPRSGQGRRHKEDLVKNGWLIQVKSCSGKAVNISLSDLRHLVVNAEAEADRRKEVVRPVVYVDIIGYPITRRRWMLVPLEEWKR